MELELPDGTVLDAPDGSDPVKIMAGYNGRRARASAPIPVPSATEGNSFLDNAMIGVGQSFHHIAARGTNLAKHLAAPVSQSAQDSLNDPSSFGSDASIQNSQDLDKDINATGGGKVGRFAGDMIATLPVGAGIGGGLARTAAALRAGSGAAKTAAAVLGSGVTRGALEGAAGGALTSDEDGAAASGARWGAGLGLGGKVLGRALAGLAEKGQNAHDLQAAAAAAGKDMFIPLGRAANEDGDFTTKVIRNIYREVLPLIPGIPGKIDAQTNRAKQMVRDLAAESGQVPGTSTVADMGGPKGPFGNTLEMGRRKAISGDYDKAYADSIKGYSFNVPADFRDRVAAKIEAAMPGVDDVTKNKVATLIDSHMSRFSSGGEEVTGTNLLNAKNASNAEYGALQGPEKEALQHGVSGITDIMAEDLAANPGKGGAENAADLAKYKALSGPYKNFTVYQKAVQAAKVKGGAFEPAQLTRSADYERTPELYGLGRTADEVLGGSVGHGSFAARTAAHGAGIFAATTHPLATVSAVLAAHGLGTEVVQKALMGDLAAQQTMTKYLRANPDATDMIGRLTRNAAVVGRN